MLTKERPEQTPPGKADSPAADSGFEESANLDSVNEKLANLSTNEKPKIDRMASLSNPFDDESDEDSEGEVDLSDYTEEIGYVFHSSSLFEVVLNVCNAAVRTRAFASCLESVASSTRSPRDASPSRRRAPRLVRKFPP